MSNVRPQLFVWHETDIDKTNQQVTLYKKSSANAISVGKNPGDTPSDLPESGDSQTVFIINKSKDFIGLTTSVGLTLICELALFPPAPITASYPSAALI